MWDWRYPINDIKDEVRKARSNGEKFVSLDSLEKLLDQLKSLYDRLESENKKNSEEKNLEKFVQKQKEVITNSYEHAKQYSNIIILGGYAGLFAIWNFTKDELVKWQVVSVGFCILISIFIFIIFELYGSWLRSTQVNNQMNELKKAEELQKFPEEYGKSELSRAALYMKIWPYFFFGAIAFGLIAAFILLWAFICGLIK